MSGRTSSALILALLGLFNPDAAQEPVVPHAPVPSVAASTNPADQVRQELAQLEQHVRSSIESHGPTTPNPPASPTPPASPAPPASPPPPASPAPPSAPVKPNTPGPQMAKVGHPGAVKPVGTPVALTPLDATYTRLSPAEISPAAKAQVQALAKAYQPKASGKAGVPVDWLPRETRKALGGNGPRDVVLLAVTEAFAWYAWAEADAAWIGRIDLANPTNIHAGPLPTQDSFAALGPETILLNPGQPVVVTDQNGNPVTLMSR